MPQIDLAEATPGIAAERRPPPAAAAVGLPRLRLAGRAPIAALAAMLPDFALAGDAPTTVLAVWAEATRPRPRVAARGLPFVRLGQGVLRAPPGAGRRPILSVTSDAVGPGSPADELDAARVLMSRGWETPALLARAAAARQAMVAARVGGAWWQGEPDLPPGDDLAIVDPAGATRDMRQRMLAAARADFPAANIVVLSAAADPWPAIARAARVYAAGGEIGFLAVLAGRAVHCFAECFYAGWGVTSDDPAVPPRPFRRGVEEIFAGACLIATRCRDPFRNTSAAFEDILEWLADCRRIDEGNRRIAACVGMSFWKKRRIADFLRTASGPPAFRRSAGAALKHAEAKGGSVAVWASRMPPGLPELAAARGVPVIRVEDGFVRSVGLGADFLPGASLVLDERGAHYDPSCPSDLEILLRETDFPKPLLERARRLTDLLVARGITKYNLGKSLPAIAVPDGRRSILVPGQVEDDLSVRLAGGDIQSNLALLSRVRTANPDAFLAYKPHPDVEAGHRKGAVPDSEVRRFADAVVRDAAIPALLSGIDELHTLTSLAGFEALLRQRKVVVYGRPFYAGWGLTEDVAAPFRGRRLSLGELVAGVLILYPRYLDPLTRLPCGPEVVIERLADAQLWRPGLLVLARRLHGLLARRWRG